jgi:hypothetical protein
MLFLEANKILDACNRNRNHAIDAAASLSFSLKALVALDR